MNISTAKKIALKPFFVTDIDGIMSTAQDALGATTKLVFLKEWGSCLVLLNWHWTHESQMRISSRFNVGKSRWYLFEMSLLIFVLERCNPNIEKCFPIMSASIRQLGRTGLIFFLVSLNKMLSNS